MRRRCWLRGDVEIEIAVMIKIDKCNAGAALLAANIHGFRNVAKFAGTVVVKKAYAVVHANREFSSAVIIVIARSASEAAA